MSSTNKTTYYELPQFVDDDIFNPLVDDNDAYDKIDTALHQIADAEADDASEIVGVKSRVTTAEGKIEALETQNGVEVLTTTAQTLSGAVNELDGDVSSLDGRLDVVEDDINNVNTGLKVKVSALETQNGSEVLTTTAQTLSGAVNELDGDVADIKAQNGNEVLTTTAQTLSGAVNELKSDIAYVTPEMFGAVGDGVADDTQALADAVEYGNTYNLPVKIKKVKITDKVRFRGDVSGGEIIMVDNAHVILSSERNQNNCIHNIKFDVSNFEGVALEVKADHSNITECEFIGVDTPSDVTAILITPYIADSEDYYVNTRKGLWGVHVDKNFFRGVKTAIKVYLPNDDLAWISDLSIVENSGLWIWSAIDIQCDNPYAINNCGGVDILNNAFSDQYTSEEARYGLKAVNVNGRIVCENSKFFSDGDDTHYYGYFYDNAMAKTKDQSQSGVLYNYLITDRFHGLVRNGKTDGLDSIMQGLTIQKPYLNHPDLFGIAKNVIFNNGGGITKPAIVSYTDNQLIYTEDGTHSNVQVTITLPTEMQKSTDHIFYMIETDFEGSGNTSRPDIFRVNGVTRSFEDLTWPKNTRNGYGFGGMIWWDDPETVQTVTMRFEAFPAGTYTIKRVLIFTDMISGFREFTNQYLDFSMFDY